MGHTGGCIVIAGPDGTGKSTLAEGLARRLAARGPVVHLHHRPSLLPRRSAHEGPVTEPHAEAPYPPVLSAMKVIYLFIDFLLGWLFKVRPRVRRGGWVVCERGWWDQAVDPRRYRLASAMPARLLGSLLPRWDLILVLELSPEEARSRKAELTLDEIARQSSVWRSLLPGKQRVAFLNAARPVEQLVRDALAEVEAIVEFP